LTFWRPQSVAGSKLVSVSNRQKNTTSAPFAQCYLQLAKLLVSTADLEEDFVRRDLAATQGNLRREPKVSAAERANRLQNYLMS